MTLFVIAIQFATGILLALNYAPTPEYAYGQGGTSRVSCPLAGSYPWLHHWGSSAMVVLVVLAPGDCIHPFHAAQRYPREVTPGSWAYSCR